MKVLYVGYYCETGEFGHFARYNILALEKAGVDVVIRPIRFSPRELTPCPANLKHLEDKDESDCNVLIQHVFPEHLVGTDKFDKNIAIFTNLVWDIKHSAWQEYLSVVDEIWAQTETVVSGLPLPRVVRQAVDTDIFKQKYRDINVPTLVDKCIFYTIGNTANAEGLAQVLRTFHAEFDRSDLAALMIVMAQNDKPEAELSQFAEQLSTNIKSGLMLETHPNLYTQDVVVIVPPMSEELLSVHQFGTQYVSCNQTLMMPLQELYAVGFGSTPLVGYGGTTANSFFYLTDGLAAINLIPAVTRVKLTSSKGMFDDTDNGNNYNLVMSEESMRRTMRRTYETWKANPVEYDLKAKANAGTAMEQFALETIGQAMKEALNGSL